MSEPSELEAQLVRSSPVEPSTLTNETDTDVPAKQHPKHRACNECRQQKLKCNLVNAEDPDSGVCSRCNKLGLVCRIDESFKRTRKRRRSQDLEREIEELKHRLSTYTSMDSSQWTLTASTSPRGSAMPRLLSRGSIPVSQLQTGNPGPSATTVPGGISPETSEVSVLGVTTVPESMSPSAGRSPVVHTAIAQTLGNIELQSQEIDELFQIYFSTYHPFLPFLNPAKSPNRCGNESPILFWMIIAVAARRLSTNPTLLTRLARSVPELIWKGAQALPHTLGLIQGLVLACAWPFPTSSSTTDPSYMYAGLMVQAALQMGLHRPSNPDDFTKYHSRLSPEQVKERRDTWIACNVVAQYVSLGTGLSTPAQLRDPSLIPPPQLQDTHDRALFFMLECAAALGQISATLAYDPATSSASFSSSASAASSAALSHELATLEVKMNPSSSYTLLYLLSAKFCLATFSLFDNPISSTYIHRIATLYSTACAVIEHIQTSSNESLSTNLLDNLPFFFYQVFLCASCVLLKVLKNDYFSSIFDTASGTRLLNSAISALRKMSVANNDLPGRLNDVLAYLWTHPRPSLVSGPGLGGLQLKVRTRMSMSIVYDCLWTWREQFQREQDGHDATRPQNETTDYVDGNFGIDPQLSAEELANLFQYDMGGDWFL
ncbi:hypothetical protein, variant [Phialophora macrospora]|uniref:Zn(2)-C6 fungal-type domain-containing protein n=1 Tax=Phialophora macrospora TaxID=1851006 RepID=A0A0D2FLW5_9EURO|nr:hypothetical protein PV04_04981 [Phialophora macrospora]KIW69084.1 hypothetical protein, variant [Phialophora macrospora]